jgi:hypothetical protein
VKELELNTSTRAKEVELMQREVELKILCKEDMIMSANLTDMD